MELPAFHNYKFTVIREPSELVDRIPLGPQPGSGISGIPIGPNATQTNLVPLGSYYYMTNPGTYVVTAVRIIELPSGKAELLTGHATVRVVEKPALTNEPTSVPDPAVAGSPTARSTGLSPAKPRGGSPGAEASPTHAPTTPALAEAEAVTPTGWRRAGPALIAGLAALILFILWRAARRGRGA